ncbi:AbiH family protein [Kaistella faecalis]|uniref:AbiH family protein n=1 Tax=Kaistella faecalis TaxID=2852098 RepID=UPI001C44FC82|nr:AbiH family protein [Chryseobacterium faecale]UFK97603.1 bacteriophage abortive infection AbiH family protein [Chryseobacterium faecale]
MNRIILIGNGFDLAHNIKTSYYDFLNHFWEELHLKIKADEYREERYEDDFIIINKVPARWLPGQGYRELTKTLKNTGTELRFKNKFLENLSRGIESLNWVDIESDYYTLLKACFQKPHSGYTITELNDDFSAMKKHLELYLKMVEGEFNEKFPVNEDDKTLKKNIYQEIYSDFKLRDFSETSINKLTEQEYQRILPTIKGLEDDQINIDDVTENFRERKFISTIYSEKDKGRRRKIRELLVSEASPNYFRFRPNEILFLNFNYTSIETQYNSAPNDEEKLERIPTSTIHIHGELGNDKNNKIIFGFGDEIDKDYNTIEDLDDNNYLENIKSIKYLESISYKSLLQFINSDDYQIFIFGHSCGISDRTLLNTLFENKNCSSIKPFYRQKDENTDNYSEIIKNITRNFTNKAVLRDRVVNKVYTRALFK